VQTSAPCYVTIRAYQGTRVRQGPGPTREAFPGEVGACRRVLCGSHTPTWTAAAWGIGPGGSGICNGQLNPAYRGGGRDLVAVV
jgi:hypothetical protein